MTRDTILGSSPRDTRAGLETVVPDAVPSDESAPATDTDASTRAGDETPDRNGPGDPTTAFNRSRLYSALALGFERPGEAFQSALDADAFGTDLVESAKALDDDLATVARRVTAQATDADALHDEWASLFGVEEGVTVSPYELTYVPGPLTTNVRKLADLAGFYEAFDLDVAPGMNDRPDHLCFLLEFLGLLSVHEAYLRIGGDEEGVAIVCDAYYQFVDDHLGRWYWRFSGEVSKQTDGFYGALADLLSALLEHEIDRLDADPDWVPDDPAVTEWTEDVFGDSGRDCGGCGVDSQGAADRPPTDGDATMRGSAPGSTVRETPSETDTPTDTSEDYHG